MYVQHTGFDIRRLVVNSRLTLVPSGIHTPYQGVLAMKIASKFHLQTYYVEFMVSCKNGCGIFFNSSIKTVHLIPYNFNFHKIISNP